MTWALSSGDYAAEQAHALLQWLTSGESNREIGRRLFIAESTVKRHVYNIFGKLKVRNRTQAALQARKLGVASHPNFLQLWEEGWGQFKGKRKEIDHERYLGQSLV